MQMLFNVFLSVDGSHPVRDVHRPGTQHQDEPEREALHLQCYSDHGLSHRDPGDSQCPGEFYKNKPIFGEICFNDQNNSFLNLI